MIGYDEIAEAVGFWNAPRRAGTYVIVPTFATYPSNSLVQAYIEGGIDRFVVSDGGGAVKTLRPCWVQERWLIVVRRCCRIF